jgi:hypothetical protein
MSNQYRKKPVLVEAVRLVEPCYNEMIAHFGEKPGEKYGYRLGTKHPYESQPVGLHSASMEEGFQMWIKTLEGTMIADYGDWIIKGVKGEFYPCKPDIFEQTYEKVD